MSAGLARFADEMVGVSVVLLVLARTGSSVLAGAAVAAYTIPSVLSGPLLGAWLDRTRRPVPALAGNQFVLAAVACGLVAVSGVLVAVWGPTLTSVITARQVYTPAALLGQVSTTGASLKLDGFAIGAAVGGVLVVRTGATTVILLVAAVHLVAAGLGSLAARPSRALRVTP
ncbi:hypothetical protein GCM10010492_05010 [Saccharothrix mutabilis subsp. mutabilis]|uniref:MFS transporter n=1 Tax=Saccharothrix mutabilis subsp. mutabilis TaxID=66855 RepID=A0ABN0T2A2_9PSEU